MKLHVKSKKLNVTSQSSEDLPKCQKRLAYRVAQIKIPHRTKCNFSTTVWDFYTHISWFIWERSCHNSEIKKKYFSFLQSYGYINILCHIFNSARNNQQQLVVFIYVMVCAGVCFGGKGRLHFIPDKTKVNAKLYVEPCCRNFFEIADLFCHLASSFNRTARLHTRQS